MLSKKLSDFYAYFFLTVIVVILTSHDPSVLLA